MVSVNYSASNASALRSLQATARSMTETQTRIATGLKINSAKDNAYLWKASESLRSDISSLAGQQDALKVAQVQADKTGAAVDAIRKVLGQMKGVVEAAAAVSGDAAKKALLQKDMAAYQEQLKSLVASAAVDSSNLLTGTATSDVIIGKDKNGKAVTMKLEASNLKFQAQEVSGGTAGLLDTTSGATWNRAATTPGSVLDFNVSSAFNIASGGTDPDAATSLAAMMKDLNEVITKVDAVSAAVASYSKRLETQADFMTKIADIQESALSAMVDADLDEESARLSALQVQQQLATTALQIANSSRANILQLFQ